MKTFVYKFLSYFAILYIAYTLFIGTGPLFVATIILAIILSIINTFIRPILSICALPLNILTIGIASVFVNMLTLIIADALVGSINFSGFWEKAAIAVAIMISDSIRWQIIKRNKK